MSNAAPPRRTIFCKPTQKRGRVAVPFFQPRRNAVKYPEPSRMARKEKLSARKSRI